MFIIANIGVNWRTKQDPYQRSIDLLDAVNGAGVHGVCVPYLRADKLYRSEDIVKQTKKFDMPPEMMYDLRKRAAEMKTTFWAAPSYHEDIAYLEQIDVDGYQIQNGDIRYTPLLKAVAETNKPVMLSTGFATLQEVHDAVETLLNGKEAGDAQLTILHSTGGMPTPSNESQLKRILDLAQEFFPLFVGYESFLNGDNVILDYVAMAYNPAIIMRRIDLDDRKGVETEYSLVPEQMRRLVDSAVAMEWVNNPVYYADEFTESDFDARIKRRRCKKSDYLTPPDK